MGKNKKLQAQVELAQKATANDVINNVSKQLKNQVNKIPQSVVNKFPGIKGNLNKLLNQSANEAKNQLGGYGDALIVKAAVDEYNKRLPAAKKQQEKLQKQWNKQIADL